MTTDMAPFINPLEESFAHDPYPAKNQCEQAAGHWNPIYKSYVFTDYAAAKQIMMDNDSGAQRVDGLFVRLPTEVQAEVAETIQLMKSWALMSDGDDHTFKRQVMNGVFTLSQAHAVTTEARLQEFLQPLLQQDGMDVVHDIAIPPPAIVIADMLGVPHQRHAWFKKCSVDIARIFMLSSNPDQKLLGPVIKH